MCAQSMRTLFRSTILRSSRPLFQAILLLVEPTLSLNLAISNWALLRESCFRRSSCRNVKRSRESVAMPPAEAIPVAEGLMSRYEVAAQILERAMQGGAQDANVLYMLAMAYKRQGKTNEARAALRKITKPDANVLLQMGLLSLKEGNLAAAEGDFMRAREQDKSSYEICFNLLLTQLTLGKVKEALELLPQALELATPDAEERRFLTILQALLKAAQKANSGALITDPVLLDMSAEDEARVLKVIKSLGQ